MKLFRFLKLRSWLWGAATSVPETATQTPACIRQATLVRSPALLVVSVVALTAAIGHRFYNEPQLAAGTPAPETVRAPRNATVEDPAATAAARQQAWETAQTVWVVDPTVTNQIETQFDQLLQDIQAARQTMGRLPFVTSGRLSTPVQAYLRQADESELLAILEAVNLPTRPLSAGFAPIAVQAKNELAAYQSSFPRLLEEPGLVQQIRQVQRQYRAALRQQGLPVQRFQRILAPPDATWQGVRPQLRQALERILTQGIPPGLPDQQLRKAVQLHLTELDTATQTAGMLLLLEVLTPNLAVDAVQTAVQREQKAQGIEPVVVTITRGRPVVRAGETITPEQFLLLDHFGLSRRAINWWRLAGVVGLVSGAVTLFGLVQRSTRAQISRRDCLLILLLAVSAPLTIWIVGPRYTSLPAVGLLVGSFYGSVLGATVIGLLTVLMPLGMSGGLSTLAAVAVGSVVGSIFARQPRSREELALLGLIVAVTQGLTGFVILSVTGVALPGALSMAALQGVIGMGWSIIALGLSPYIEHVFDLVTPIRLAELANPNRPMLKRLAQEAPGTFQHTLFVATLAEAGARALQGNVELVRTGTLYHDIGKMHDPQAFIENQRHGENKHERLNDPWQSADIIKKHVTEGLVMARKCRLPTAIQAFIPEHQGTMTIAYFHHQAEQMAVEDPERAPIDDADFRYDGPIPQSRETGIVMLADSCEAALRSLKDATPEGAKQTVRKIFKARWQDEQLVDSQLTRADLDTLVEVFVEVWMQFHHQRIPYPVNPRTERNNRPLR